MNGIGCGLIATAVAPLRTASKGSAAAGYLRDNSGHLVELCAAMPYHIHLRMDAARRLLRETRKSVVEVALDVGYANPSHFAQLFRRETGLSPSDYRRQR